MNYEELNKYLRKYKEEPVKVFYEQRGYGKVVSISKVILPDSEKETIEIDFGNKGKCSFIVSDGLANILFKSQEEYEQKVQEENEKREILRKIELEKNEKLEIERLQKIEDNKLSLSLMVRQMKKKTEDEKNERERQVKEIEAKREKENKELQLKLERERKEKQERKDKAKANREFYKKHNRHSELSFMKNIQRDEEKRINESKDSVVKVIGRKLVVGFTDEDNK